MYVLSTMFRLCFTLFVSACFVEVRSHSSPIDNQVFNLDSLQECPIQLSLSSVVLKHVEFNVEITLPPFLSLNESIPIDVYSSLTTSDYGPHVLSHRTRNKDGTSTLQFDVAGVVSSLGYHDVHLNISVDSGMTELLCQQQTMRVLSIPGIVTLLPPMIAAILAIVLRQVILAILVGIWLCSTIANKFNPLLGGLRTLDTYFVGSIGEFDHAAVIVFTFLLGGLIGVIRKSGGGQGVAKLLFRFANSRRKATVVCALVCALIFFDDFSIVLVTGTSLRTVMQKVSVSKEKFAYIIQSFGPTISSLFPVSSWVAVQVGYIKSALESISCSKCSESGTKFTDAYILMVQTIPYRFFPILVIFTVTLVCFLNRDFGPMLTAEQSSNVMVTERRPDQDEETERSEITDSLSPKKGIRYRWFNAGIPFLIVVVVMLVGMVLDGRQKILDQTDSARVELTVANIFTYADALSAMIWSTALALVVLLVMLLVQRIFSIREFMEAWIEGIKSILEPLLMVILAWALGSALQDIHASSYIAYALKGGNFPYRYLPVVVTIISFLFSYAIGGSFGAMGVLFPLIVPTACEITACNDDVQDLVIQCSAAIMGGTLFGPVFSPMAPITILTTVTSQCSLLPHLKTASLYSVIIGFVVILFGALPVGAHWYPWYAAWLIMAAVIVTLFILFSTNITSPTSRPLLKRICPCVYKALSAVSRQAEQRLRAMCRRVGNVWMRLKCWRSKTTRRSRSRGRLKAQVSDSEFDDDDNVDDEYTILSLNNT